MGFGGPELAVPQPDPIDLCVPDWCCSERHNLGMGDGRDGYGSCSGQGCGLAGAGNASAPGRTQEAEGDDNGEDRVQYTFHHRSSV